MEEIHWACTKGEPQEIELVQIQIPTLLFSFFLINFKIENAGHNIQGITDHVQQIIVTE